MSKQPEALRLVDQLRASAYHENAHLFFRAADQIERLHSVNADLLEALRIVLDAIGALHKPYELEGYGLEPEQIASVFATLSKATWEA